MSRHRAFSVVTTIANGFDVVEAEGVTYLRVIIARRAVYAVPQTSAELRTLARLMVIAADTIDQGR